jgi:RNA polymerase sigma-70 factor (ECF subfamily)
VFVLRDVEGLSTEETAAALELSVPAVKSRLLRARLQLRERLGRYFQRRENGNGKNGEAKNADVKTGDVKTGDAPSGDGNQ